MSEDNIYLENELRRLSKLETVCPYVRARLYDAAEAIRTSRELKRSADRLYRWLDRATNEHCGDGIRARTFIGANDALSAYSSQWGGK